MTKILLAAFFALVSGTAVGQSLKVQLVANETNPSAIEIQFETVAEMSSMCFMQVNALALTAPTADQPGTITVAAAADINAPCLTAFGPHRGHMTLTRGHQLPSLGEGEYILSINEETYGSLVVTADGAELKTTNDNNDGSDDLPAGQVELTGVLHTGIAAIGGETTGIVLVTADGQFELQLADDAMTYAAEELTGAIVKVVGEMIEVEGVEIPSRTIIKVSQLDPA